MNQILVIDDDKLIRMVLTENLKKAGYDILEAEDGKLGLELFKAHYPPVTILDLEMPNMNGIEFLEQLDPQLLTSHVVIVLTGGSNDEKIERCYELGVQSFMKKPFNPVELRGLVQRSLELLQAHVEIKELNHRMTSLLHNIPDLIWECDTKLLFTYVSDNVEKFLGYTKEDLLRKPMSDFLSEEDVGQFHFKMHSGHKELSPQIRGLTLRFMTRDGTPVSMQISANQVVDLNGHPKGMAGIAREILSSTQAAQEIGKITQKMTIRVDGQMKLVFVDDSAKKYFPADSQEEGASNFTQYLIDPSVENLFSFSFDQKEDVPFPVEVKLLDNASVERNFTVQFQFKEELELLEGQLIPVGTEDQLAMISEKVEQQSEALKNAVVIDPEMQREILTDSQNLSGEILNIIKSMAVYTFEEERVFNLEEYGKFLQGKDLYQYGENLRLLGNKIHGLKGSSGFLMPASKQLCHRMEELTRPLAEYRLVWTTSIGRLLKQFIFKVQEMLEQYEKEPESEFSVEDWLEKIDYALKQAEEYVANQQNQLVGLITGRSVDKGEVRKPRKEDYLSVSLQGYEDLSQQVQNLYYTLSASLSQEDLIQAATLYNEFLDTHQQIKKIPVDLSRYERLVPSLAEQYSKEADFVFKDHHVRADREFWNSMHEIFNHSLKNAAIHGLETPEEREEHGKSRTGAVTVEIEEDALHIFVSISDDGRGINMAKIEEKALENQIITPEQLKSMSQQDILNLVFVQGVSTADSLDDNAGRGVGMNAVQEAMRRFNGSCRILSDEGQGSSWNFTFPKNNVSLPCFLVTVGDFRIAIPEASVDTFREHDSKKISLLNQTSVFQHQETAIPLVNPQSVFDEDALIDEKRDKSILILKLEQEKKAGIVINDILYHATLPILPLPKQYRHLSLYVGTVLFGNELVLVLNANRIS
ncbi:MAG: response regulator [SAR324 cluster bacterium]|nr:response regulator [SAR324 cluster bacterium]